MVFPDACERSAVGRKQTLAPECPDWVESRHSMRTAELLLVAAFGRAQKPGIYIEPPASESWDEHAPMPPVVRLSGFTLKEDR